MRLDALAGVVQLDAGGGDDAGAAGASGDDQSFSCAVFADGHVACWGSNWDGECGVDPSMHAVPVPHDLGIAGVLQVSAGGAHACARTETGEVWCWGRNADGQLGSGDRLSSFAAVRVAGPW